MKISDESTLDLIKTLFNNNNRCWSKVFTEYLLFEQNDSRRRHFIQQIVQVVLDYHFIGLYHFTDGFAFCNASNNTAKVIDKGLLLVNCILYKKENKKPLEFRITFFDKNHEVKITKIRRGKK